MEFDVRETVTSRRRHLTLPYRPAGMQSPDNLRPLPQPPLPHEHEQLTLFLRKASQSSGSAWQDTDDTEEVRNSTQGTALSSRK